MNELMFTHHELAPPRILASLHELNCNQRAIRHNSCRRQFTKAQLSVYMHRRIANYACEPSENLGSSSAEIRKRTAIEDNPYPLVEAAGLEPTVSSSRTNTPSFFDYFC